MLKRRLYGLIKFLLRGVMTENNKWAVYHAFKSNSKDSGGRLRYLTDMLDIHPVRSVKFIRAHLYSLLTGKKIPVFVHIPKTGGTYVASCFPRDGFVTLNHMLLRDKLTDQYIPVGLMGTKWRPSSNHVLFTTVRNPITFFRSYYHHVVGHGQYHNHEHYDFKIATKGFDYLMQTIMDREDPWPSRKFLYPQLFDGSGKLIVNWVNRNETLDKDMTDFAKLFGYEFKSGSKKRMSPVKNLREYYTDSLMERVCEVYSRVFKVFGYSMFGLETKGKLYHDVTSVDICYNYINDKLYIL